MNFLLHCRLGSGIVVLRSVVGIASSSSLELVLVRAASSNDNSTPLHFKCCSYYLNSGLLRNNVHMIITSATLFGTAFVIFGIYIIIKKHVTISWGEGDTAPESQYKGINAVVIGLTCIFIGYLIINNETFSRYTILTL